jgi:subtilisin-like proprotein convertase family protein
MIGEWKPTFPLSEFNGLLSNNEWTLLIEDNSVRDNGKVNYWGLEIISECSG